MNKQKSVRSSSNKLEGEGSYTATRRYNAHLRQAVAKGDSEKLAEAARRALEGPEGPELKRAEREAKRGRSLPRKPAQQRGR